MDDRKARPQEWSQLRLLLLILSKIPLVISILFLHAVRLSVLSKYLDIRSDLTVSIIRNLLSPKKHLSMAKVQALSIRDPGIKGRLWVSKVASTVPPEEDIRDALFEVVDAMRTNSLPGSEAKLRVPDLVPVEAEWTGYRKAATPKSTLPVISEAEKYEEMMKECKSRVTILYFHGGAYYLMDPATHRPGNKKLAKMTGGRVYSVRYRLAPQNPFPAALLDGLVSYFTLLYPPPGAIHDAVAPEDVVFAGDSAGGNLSLALLQTLLQLRRQHRRIRWFGEMREVVLPAAVTGNSPWCDVTQSMPSCRRNLKFDYLPKPGLLAERNEEPSDIWPAKPPRRHVYVDDEFLLHPLVCLHLNTSWEGAPPIYICCGWECLADEIRYLVKRLSRDGVKVVFEEYQAMPHAFPLILTWTQESRRCFEGWAKFITEACGGGEEIEPRCTMIKVRTLQEIELDVDTLSPYTETDAKRMAWEMLGEDHVPETMAKL